MQCYSEITKNQPLRHTIGKDLKCVLSEKITDTKEHLLYYSIYMSLKKDRSGPGDESR